MTAKAGSRRYMASMTISVRLWRTKISLLCRSCGNWRNNLIHSAFVTAAPLLSKNLHSSSPIQFSSEKLIGLNLQLFPARPFPLFATNLGVAVFVKQSVGLPNSFADGYRDFDLESAAQRYGTDARRPIWMAVWDPGRGAAGPSF